MVLLAERVGRGCDVLLAAVGAAWKGWRRACLDILRPLVDISM